MDNFLRELNDAAGRIIDARCDEAFERGCKRGELEARQAIRGEKTKIRAVLTDTVATLRNAEAQFTSHAGEEDNAELCHGALRQVHELISNLENW